MMTVKIGILGCGGRMGKMLVKAVIEKEGATLIGGVEYAGSPLIGEDVGIQAACPRQDVAVSDDAAALFAAADAIIDFTLPQAVSAHAALAAETGTAYILGTTGLAPEIKETVDAAAGKAAVVHAHNYSMGVTLLCNLVEKVAATLDEDFDIDIVEMHHRYKIDAPSGTAVSLGEAAARGRGIDFADNSVLSREGQTGERERGSIGFATLRGGDVVGEHDTIFAADGERLILGHKATDRGIFARGAVRAAIWAAGQSAGLYDMNDVLGLD